MNGFAGLTRVCVLAALVTLTGCATVLEGDARQCHRDAYTVEAMQRCAELYPQHNGTITDRIAQPLGEWERHRMNQQRNKRQ